MSKRNLLMCFGLVILLLFIASCAKPATLQYQEKVGTTQAKSTDTKDTQDKQEPIKEEVKQETTTDTKEEPDEETKDDGELKAKDLLKQEGRAEVTTLGESSQVDATFFGRNEVFTVPYTDRDAIVFDVAQKFGITLQEVRLVIEYDGQPYLREEEKEQLEIEVKGQDSIFNESDSNPYDNLGYAFTKDDGFIRAVGCNLENKVIKFQLTNFKDDQVFRYDPEAKPKIQNPLTVYFNKKRLVDSFCDGVMVLEPGETMECFHSGVDFVNSPQSGSVYDEIELNEDLQDELVVTQPGYSEPFNFLCTAEAASVEPEDSNQTNSTE